MMKNETGRSMVEMLGVLAIIGVLSVGGIAGYTMAMNKYRANEILNTASQAVILAKAYNGGAGTSAAKSNSDLGLPNPYGSVTVSVAATQGTDEPLVTIDNATPDVCKIVVDSSPASGSNMYSITAASCPTS